MAKAMICDIFIKSYPADYSWLRHCIRSIDKFATGFRNVIIATPDYPKLQKSIFDHGFGALKSYVIKPVTEYCDDGYLSQQIFKLYADELTDADHICYLDSDCIFTQPVTPEMFFRDGKPIWMMTDYAQTKTPWQPIVEKFIGLPFRIEYEFMRRHPQCVPRWLLQSCRKYCEVRHHMSLRDYVMSQPYREMSEFNILGALAYYFRNENFTWINTATVPEKDWPPLTVLQKYSWSGLSPEIEAEFTKILK